MGVGRLVLLGCVISTVMTADSAVIDDQSWNELERFDVCSEVDYPETCALCPAAIPRVSVWRCCHDPRAFEECTAAVGNTLEDSGYDKRKTKYFLGKKRGVKYFLGKRSLGARQPFFDHLQQARESAFRRQHARVPDKRVKYFLG